MLKTIQEKLAASNTKLVAVSKTKPVEQILDMYHQGQKVFGENRVQELVEKHAQLPKDIEWHLIGHLQTNKVKYIAPFVAMIHAVDSFKLLEEINKQAQKEDRIIPVLLQFRIAEEDSKYGLEISDAVLILESEALTTLENIQICGVMGMATFTHDLQQVRTEFQQLKRYFDLLKTRYFSQDLAFKEISMGMSGDYEIAIEEGSTMVRIGSLLFGNR